LAEKNKCLADSNKSRTGPNTTKKQSTPQGVKTTNRIEPEAAPATLAEPLQRYAVLIQHSVDNNLVGPFASESDALEWLRNRALLLEDAKADCKIFAMMWP
jgi:hypothetical protein